MGDFSAGLKAGIILAGVAVDFAAGVVVGGTAVQGAATVPVLLDFIDPSADNRECDVLYVY